MLTGHRSVTRRRSQRSRAARVAVPLAIPVALGVALGIFIAVSNNGHATSINQSAFGRHRQPGASATPTAGGTTAPTASASAPAPGSGAAVAPASSFANGAAARFQLGDVATTPVDGTGAAINMQQNAAAAANSLSCTIAVPANPLSAAGLATPYQLGDGCSMANGAEEAFVEATILAPNGRCAPRATVRRMSGSETVPKAALSEPKPVSWTSFDGGEAHGLYWPPASERFVKTSTCRASSWTWLASHSSTSTYSGLTCAR